MFGIDRAWWIIPLIFVVVLLVWGPGRMPEVGAGMGRAIREFRQAMSGIRTSVVESVSVSPDSASPSSTGQGRELEPREQLPVPESDGPMVGAHDLDRRDPRHAEFHPTGGSDGA
ncbi:MAG: Sec-independent protein translocase subunit TatA/TatB [Nitrososphaerales archaeon]